MGKKRARDRIVNPQPFLAEQPPMVSKKPKPPKRRSLHDNHHHEQPSSISNSMSDKILKEAYKQQKQIIEEQNQETVAFPVDLGDKERQEDEEEDLDDFAGFDDTQSQFDDYEDQINEADERLLESFLSKDAGPQRTLGDIIAARIKEQEATESSGGRRPMPKLDNKVIEHYKMMGKLLSTYTDGQLPKGLKPIPAYKCWQEILYLTEPEKWSPSALYQVTRIFASNMNKKKAERFYKLVLLPRFKEDIRKHKRLHTALFQSLKKALYKPSAFNKGILIPLFESGNCSLREAAIMGSVIQKMSIPLNHSSGLLLRLAEMDYCGTTSYIIKTFIDKKYALPYRVLDALVAHFMRFLEDPRAMPVIWHQTLLAFVQRYKHELQKEDKDNLNALMQKQSHYLVTPEILRELKDSRNRGEKEEDNMLMSSPVSIINKTIQEDRFDIPEVPMEED